MRGKRKDDVGNEIRHASLKQMDTILKILESRYPSSCTTLSYRDPFTLLVATLLSAQCTDVRVNQVTKELFKKAVTPSDFATMPLDSLEKAIYATGFYRMKAKHIRELSQKIIHDFSGEVPQSMDLLLQLPGVGRKTANVVLGTAFGIAAGVVVDTHVMRISRRLGLTNEKTSEAIERKLMTIVPKKKWIGFSHLLIAHGRACCIAKKPRCQQCALRQICSYWYKHSN